MRIAVLSFGQGWGTRQPGRLLGLPFCSLSALLTNRYTSDLDSDYVGIWVSFVRPCIHEFVFTLYSFEFRVAIQGLLHGHRL